MAQTVIGMFDNASEAQQAVQQLVNSGFSRDNIDLSSSTGSGSSWGSDASSGSDTLSSGSSNLGSDTFGTGAMGTGSMGTGAMGTGTMGTGMGTSSTDAGSLGTGSVGNDSMGLGSSSTNLGSSSTNLGSSTGSTSGSSSSWGSDDSGSGSSSGRHESKGSGIGNFFRSLFGNDDEADTYSNVAQKSGSIVTVHAQSNDEAERAADILDEAGAVDVDERAAQYGYNSNKGSGTSGTTDIGTSGTTDNYKSGDTGTSLPIIEEEIEVGKRMVQTGGKRLRSRIIERPVEESLRLREERVTVERNTVDRPATEADFAAFKETEIELTEQSEVPVVSKQARVVEEISLDKEVDTREETIRDTVRSTQVDIEDLDNDNIRRGTSGYTDSGSDKQNNF